MNQVAFVSKYTNRRGMTLIETLVLITLSAVMTGIVVSGVAGIYRFNQAINEHANGQLAMRRFSTALRSDIHRAETCRWQAGDQTLVMELAQSHSLKYHKHKQRWVRSDQVADSEPTLTSFGLDESFRCDCQQEQVSRGGLIRLTFSNAIQNNNAIQSQSRRPLKCEIVAEVGRDYRDLHE